MNFSRLMLCAAMLCGIAAQAEARQDPEPKPSGIVVHLFGPNSILGNIAPDLPGETANPATVQPVTAQPGGAQPGGGQVTAAAAPGAVQPANATDPSVGAILHQMFVVGDPNAPNKPSIGRGAERPSAGN